MREAPVPPEGPEAPDPAGEATEADSSTWGARYRAFVESERGKLTILWAKRAFTVAIVAMLAVQLTYVGWGEVWQAMPTNPLFYLLFVLIYLQLTVAEITAYRLCWTFDIREAFPAFIKKRIYNRDVLGYSGEVYFFTWARKHVNETPVFIGETIRDQNIISSLASTAVAVALLGVFLTFGQVSMADLLAYVQGWEGLSASYVIFGVLITGVVVALAVRFRRYLFTMPWRLALIILALHVFRLLVGQALQIGQWAVGVPGVPLATWFTLAAASLVAGRIPFLPNRDLIFVSAGLAISDAMNIEAAGLATVLLVNSVLHKIVNFSAFTYLSVREREKPEPLPAEVETDAAEPGGDRP